MTMNDGGLFAITLYVADATARALNGDVALQRVVLDGMAELDFLSPAWWESSHTVRLGLAGLGVAATPRSRDAADEEVGGVI